MTNFVFSQTKCLYLFFGRMYPPISSDTSYQFQKQLKKKLMLVEGQT